MSDVVESLKQKRKVVDQLRQDKSRQDGQFEQLLKQIKEECNVDGITEAEIVIHKLIQECADENAILKELDAELAEIIRKATPGTED